MELGLGNSKENSLIAGEVHNMLTAVRLIPRDAKNVYWLFRCECGEDIVTRTSRVVRGDTVSCGCYGRARKFTHRKSKSPEYKIWDTMIQRCSNENSKSYKEYGARGVTVCDRWREFANFYEDMGPRPSSKHSVDRIDNNKEYNPSNCRWATKKQQMRNRRNTVYLSNGMSIAEAAERAGLRYKTVWKRLRNGWHPEEALSK